MKNKRFYWVMIFGFLLSTLSACGGGGGGGSAPPPAYTVTYNGNTNTGGTVPIDTKTYSPTFTVTVLSNGTLTKAGYTFASWNTQANGNGTDSAPSSTFAMGSANVTLYAKWTASPTVTYNANTGTGGVPIDSNNYPPGTAVTVLSNGTLTKAGYTFTSWNTQADGNGTDITPSATFAMGTANVTLYAKWSDTTVATPVIVTSGSIVNQTSKNVDATGGSLTLTQGAMSGLTATFPAGALPKGVSVSLGNTSGTFTPNSGTPGTIFSINVPGVKSFGQPATITVPFSGNGVPVPYYIDNSGKLNPVQLLSIDRTNHTFTFQTFHASLYTWIVAELQEIFGSSADIIGTNYNPSNDGFKITNNSGPLYYPDGECFGFTSFSLWYFLNYKASKGNLYSKYNSVVGTDSAGNSLTGQDIIAARAFISISQQWHSYLPTVARQSNLTEEERSASIKNIIKNTSQPVLVYLWHTDGSIGAHSVLCYAYKKSTNNFYMYNPNNPGVRELMTYNSTSKKFEVYAGYDGIIYNGSGSLFLTEPYQNILDDADANFHSSGAAVINITSHTNGQTVSARNISLSGKITSGQVLITKLNVTVGSDTFATNVGTDGTFTTTISLTSGINHIRFTTQGPGFDGQLIDQLPNNMATTDFTLNLSQPKSVILMTLTWDTNDTDLDTYVIDPTGDYSSYYHKVTADGGALDYDITTGYGPEHWTLLNTNTVRYGQPYKFRVHYFSDNGHGPSNYTVAIKLYEGTSRETTYYYRGNLSVSGGFSNDLPNNSGLDWRDVASITLTNSATQAVAARQITSDEIPLSITVPIPYEMTRRAIKKEASR